MKERFHSFVVPQIRKFGQTATQRRPKAILAANRKLTGTLLTPQRLARIQQARASSWNSRRP